MDTISDALKRRIEARAEAEAKAPKSIKGLPVKEEDIQAITGLPKAK